MELKAAIEALSTLKYPCEVKLYSDSAYLINAFEKKWIPNWLKNGWRNSQGKPVENQDLWRRLIELNGVHKVEWIKVAGHQDNVYNNRCDQLARTAVQKS
jgi:ribonuclease HI